MIVILDQDKNGIYSWDNVYLIGNEIRTSRDRCDFNVLGTYATEERAKQVIADMWNWMENGDVGVSGKTYFAMPKE